MIRIGIIGAASLSAGKLLEILLRHPSASIAWCASDSSPDEPLYSVHPQLRGRTDIRFSSYETGRLRECDLVFSCRRPGDSFANVTDILDAGCRFVDFSGDFRLQGTGDFAKWYGIEHKHDGLLREAVYGLPELHRERIRNARLVANPGCYTTVSILACAPFVRAGYAADGPVIIDAVSGVSGAGRTPKAENLFVEVAENVRAYRVGNHQHTPEIEQELTGASPGGQPVTVLFVPHVGPFRVGIMADCYFRLGRNQPEPTDSDLHALLAKAYEAEPFVRVFEPGRLPQTDHAVGTNYCDLGAKYDPRTRTVVVFGVIDNLIKGAAGQAVQNMNIMFGLDERTALM